MHCILITCVTWDHFSLLCSQNNPGDKYLHSHLIDGKAEAQRWEVPLPRVTWKVTQACLTPRASSFLHRMYCLYPRSAVHTPPYCKCPQNRVGLEFPKWEWPPWLMSGHSCVTCSLIYPLGLLYTPKPSQILPANSWSHSTARSMPSQHTSTQGPNPYIPFTCLLWGRPHFPGQSSWPALSSQQISH